MIMAKRSLPVFQPKRPAMFDCDKCPAHCCSYYEVDVTSKDIQVLAKGLRLSERTVERQFIVKSKEEGETRLLLKMTPDKLFGKSCALLNKEKRFCSVYHFRPKVCQEYPAGNWCGYYDHLSFERQWQDDETVIACSNNE